MPIDRGMDKEAVVHIYNALLSQKKECESVIMRWMNLEPLVQSEASQKEKNTKYINTYIRTWERWYWWPHSQGSTGDADVKNRLMNNVGSGVWWDEQTQKYGNIYTIYCMPQGIQTGALRQPRGVGWDGRWEEGSGSCGHMCTYGWFILMYGWNQHNIVKQLSFNYK